MTLSSSLLLLLVSCSFVAAESENVIVLTDSNFDSVINENEFVLVKFYAPWCGHCKAIAPKYDEAADELKNGGSAIRLGKVDATENQQLAGKYEVRGYPTLLFFRNGKPTKYTGGRDTAQIVDWVIKKSGPSIIEIETAEKFNELKKSHKLVLLSNIKEGSETSKIFKELADSVDDVFFCQSSLDEISTTATLESEGLAFFRKNGEDFEITTIKSSDIETVDQLKKWIHAHKLALVTEFTSETASDIVGGDLKHFHFLIVSKGDVNFEKLYTDFSNAAKAFRGRLVFVLLDVDLDENQRILDFLGVSTTDVPTSRILNLESDVEKYRPAADQSYEEFTNSYLGGNGIQDLKSQPLPEDWDVEPVKVLVAENFNKVALDKTKNVFVKFYAPWCGHCKKLIPVWDELAKKYESNPNVVIAKLDSTLNELVDVKVQSFPTLKFWPAGSSTPVDYDGERTFDEFVKFIDGQLGASTENVKEVEEEKHDEL